MGYAAKLGGSSKKSERNLLAYRYGYRDGSYYATTVLKVSYGVGLENITELISYSVRAPYQGTSDISSRSVIASDGTNIKTQIQAGYRLGYIARININDGPTANLDGDGARYYLGYVDSGDTCVFVYTF